MKQYILSSALLFLMVCVMTGQVPVDHDEDKKKMVSILQRVRQGDTSALTEATSLDPSVSIPALGALALNRSTDVNMAGAANVALSQIPNVEEYLGNQIKTLSAQGTSEAAFARATAFDILAQIHTDKAAATIARYLFDDITPEFNGGDYVVEPNKFIALMRLTEMHLSYAPTNEKSQLSYDGQITLWRKWAMTKGFAPKDYKPEPTPAILSSPTATPISQPGPRRSKVPTR